MLKWEEVYYNNFIKNFILEVLCNKYGKDFSELCILDTTVEDVWLDFYIETVQAAVVTSLNDYIPSPKKYSNCFNYDFVDRNLQECLGPFTKQYNVVHILDSLSLELDDYIWQKMVENICSYLKKDGIIVVSGDLHRTYIEDTFKNRSEGLWRAIINNCGCSITHFVKRPFKNVFNKPYDLLIVGKK